MAYEHVSTYPDVLDEDLDLADDSEEFNDEGELMGEITREPISDPFMVKDETLKEEVAEEIVELPEDTSLSMSVSEEPEIMPMPTEAVGEPIVAKPVVAPMPTLEEETEKLRAQIPQLEAMGIDEAVISLVADKLNKNLRKIEVKRTIAEYEAELHDAEVQLTALKVGGDPELAEEIVALQDDIEALRTQLQVAQNELKAKQAVAKSKGAEDGAVKAAEAGLLEKRAGYSRWFGSLRPDEKPEGLLNPFHVTTATRKTRSDVGKPRGSGGTKDQAWSAVPLVKKLLESTMPSGEPVMPRDEEHAITLGELRQRINETGCLNDVLSLGRVICNFDDPTSRDGLHFKKCLEMESKLGKQYRLMPVVGSGSNEHPEETRFYAFEQ